MKYEDLKTLVCPKCGVEYTGRSAVSRIDNTTGICSDCATRESLETIGVIGEEQDAILETIHRSYQE